MYVCIHIHVKGLTGKGFMKCITGMMGSDKDAKTLSDLHKVTYLQMYVCMYACMHVYVHIHVKGLTGKGFMIHEVHYGNDGEQQTCEDFERFAQGDTHLQIRVHASATGLSWPISYNMPEGTCLC